MAAVDAIIVPISHPVGSLHTAIALAIELKCPLVALCSQQASAEEALRLVHDTGAALVAINTEEMPAELLPRFATSELLSGTRFAYPRDTSTKRNLGLLLASLLGWRRIVFLDDDIVVPTPGDLGRAAYLLDRHAAVGLSIGDFPDNSVVCHANRATGGDQDTFIGGGALVVDTASRLAFFPDIYNEDWFFLLDDERLCSATMIGSAEQSPYDPYASTDRATAEEFGDCLAEGVFRLLDRKLGISDATLDHWREFLGLRSTFIDELIDRIRLTDKPVYEKDRIAAALTAARNRSGQIEPALCVAYLQAWLEDRGLWRRHVADRLDQFGVPGGAKVSKVLSGLGLLECSSLTIT
ncbi:MAG TPA: hypothetical protein VGL06_02840 [Pseudonocardiaceae bacterium]